jgi:outer membrane biosynthesis protein TonB
MKAHHASFVAALSLALALPLVGCGAEPDGATTERGSALISNAGYGYEFEDDNVVAPSAPPAAAPATSPAVLGGRVAPELLQNVVRAHAAEINTCHAAAQQRNAAVSGKIVVHFVIQADGTVDGARDAGSTVTDAAMIGCVVGAFSGFHFPASTAGLITAVYPLLFTP